MGSLRLLTRIRLQIFFGFAQHIIDQFDCSISSLSDEKRATSPVMIESQIVSKGQTTFTNPFHVKKVFGQLGAFDRSHLFAHVLRIKNRKQTEK
jgi:hypothetical protein